MIKNNLLATMLVTVFTATLAACGGSSDSENTTEPTDTSGTTTTVINTVEDEFGLWLTDLTASHILPGYQNLADKAQFLTEQSSSFCALSSKSSSELTLVQDAWRAVSVSWQTIQWLKVGPVLEDFRNYRLNYWPDSNGSVSTGLASLLAQDATVTEAVVSGKTVGSQGLPAMEILLFSDGSDESLLTADDKAKRCEVLQAISANVTTIASEVNSEWQTTGGNYQAELIAGTGDFTSKTDAVEELVTNWLEQIELVKDEKMLAPLGDASPGESDLAEQSLSDESLSSLKINIATFRVIYTAGDGHGFDDILTDFLEQTNINTEMLSAIDTAIASADKLTGSYATLLSSEEGRVNINTAIDDLRQVRDLLTADFVQATDINIGFNSNDGD